ncbi:MAG: (2Fe-2S)-binding protein [Candidatus Hydrogenedentes bacterium]|nr:(2Fe-2S)-binding protein [Candidatus Hydrogenedentota bacterium]
MPTIVINNRSIDVENGTTVLQAARALGIEVPTLCYWEGVRPMNSCMLCVVRNTKTGQLLPSCSSVVQEGMTVETDTGDVCNARKEVLELIISEHIGDCEAPCTHTCPASMNIPVMMRQIYDGDFDAAAFTVTNGLVFPGTLGHVCPAPCENPCRRKSYDETMEIRFLHRNVAAKARTDNPELLECPPDSGRKVAIVGGGLAGMAAAWVLRKRGHAATIFEKEDKAGGKLRKLTEDELPKEVLDAEIDQVRRLGVEFTYGTAVNGDLESICASYDAVILACNGVGKAGGSVFEAKEHKLNVRAVGNGKTAAVWVDKYLKSIEGPAEPKLFESKIGKMDKSELENMREHNENKESMAVASLDGTRVDLRAEAGRCLHCDCRKRVSCGLRKWASEYGAEKKKYLTTEERDFRIIGRGNVLFEPGKCIRCGLCVAIAEKHGEDIGLAFSGRGFDLEIRVPFDHSFDEALRKSADECVAACPTAAIAFRNKEDVEACHTTTWIELDPHSTLSVNASVK